ncbi:hypothetical protein D3C71_1093260 [compost metagenome]
MAKLLVRICLISQKHLIARRYKSYCSAWRQQLCLQTGIVRKKRHEGLPQLHGLAWLRQPTCYKPIYRRIYAQHSAGLLLDTFLLQHGQLFLRAGLQGLPLRGQLESRLIQLHDVST